MGPRRSFFVVRGASAPGNHCFQVVIQLGAQANGLYMMVIIAVTRLVSKACVKSFALAIVPIAQPNPIARLLPGRLGERVQARRQNPDESLHGPSKTQQRKGTVAAVAMNVNVL